MHTYLSKHISKICISNIRGGDYTSQKERLQTGDRGFSLVH